MNGPDFAHRSECRKRVSLDAQIQKSYSDLAQPIRGMVL
ncbi:hypothetical protein SJ05684_c33630 [Sinorhizobium sojae CCBAU 05684]|uniref:Uncharacterized protein n=1 Tax=Sinorhizobium sojae CCBAU 05684 TaxID=716928 RepID=A0A249PGA0_9HYPH|nr:hypothetical protein SJ05684_c33630 [Sinorhizobium sojae CCBAU 05684]